ncbi:Mth938-like domain-containing protein [Thiosocius teredinicola]|uniref:Mth938-like domain-containing protein n=1 Tax=Thiosocius teredinicola TaxID=1973002 RepID=UPI000990AAE6
MKMALDGAANTNVVKSYRPGEVQIRQQRYKRSLIVLPNEIVDDWPADDASRLCAADLRPIADRQPEVLILGTGDIQVFPDPGIFVTLIDLQIGFEVMDNAAACRTFNILLAEQRRVALALLFPPIDN